MAFSSKRATNGIPPTLNGRIAAASPIMVPSIKRVIGANVTIKRTNGKLLIELATTDIGV